MRQLLTYWPPRIVSAKCTMQLSRSSTFASAVATPPSAITVCALPSSDLQIKPTFTPAAEASIAARRPAPPAPITRTSYSCVCITHSGGRGALRCARSRLSSRQLASRRCARSCSSFTGSSLAAGPGAARHFERHSAGFDKIRHDSPSVASEDPVIGPDPHRAESHVDIGECDGAEAEPGKELMSPVEPGDAGVARPAKPGGRDLVAAAADEMSKGMAAERVAGEQQRVHG